MNRIKKREHWQILKDLNDYLNADLKPQRINTLTSWNWNETTEHFITKAMVYKILRERDKNVFTEVRILNGIVDVFNLDDQIIYEIETEKKESTRKQKLDQFKSYLIKDVVFIYLKDLPKKWEERYKYLQKIL